MKGRKREAGVNRGEQRKNEESGKGEKGVKRNQLEWVKTFSKISIRVNKLFKDLIAIENDAKKDRYIVMYILYAVIERIENEMKNIREIWVM